MDPSDRIYDAARQDGRGHRHVEGQNPFGSLTPPCSMSPWPRGDPLDASTAMLKVRQLIRNTVAHTPTDDAEPERYARRQLVGIDVIARR
jgi:hypothetical protein